MARRKIDTNIMSIVNKYIEEISKHYEIDEVYVFGSYINGRNREDSDIDIAIILNSDIDTIDLMVDLMILTKDIDLRIEPHPIKVKDFREGNPFVEEIKNTGLKVA